jgi:hypothetical protein
MARYSVPRVRENLIGKTFRGFKVISKLANGYNGRVYWGCICIICNSEEVFKVRDDRLKKDPVGCRACVWRNNAKNVKSGNRSKVWKGTKDISKTYFNNLKRGSKRATRTLEFSVSLEYLQHILELQNYKCALSNIDLITHSTAKRDSTEATISLDRIDPTQGYVEGNVQWVHKDINLMKFDFNEKNFIELCGLVWSHHLASTRTTGNSSQAPS